MVIGASEIVKFTKNGIYCPKGDFWIDPSIKVEKAFITHAHSDHARRGHTEYYCTNQTASLLKLFFGTKIKVVGLDFTESISVNGVKITLFPAGHVLGSAQILIEYEGIRVAVAGDYKLEDDGLTGPFVPVECDIFVTESTFAKPKYDWALQNEVVLSINEWWKKNQELGKVSILNAYSLGKSQRLLKNIDSSIGEIYTVDSTARINEIYNLWGKDLPGTGLFTERSNMDELRGSLLILPHSGLKFPNVKDFEDKSVAFVSGWVADRWMFQGEGFILSDHADWKGLIEAVESSKAQTIYVQHGFTSYFTKYLKSRGLDAYDLVKCVRNEGMVELF